MYPKIVALDTDFTIFWGYLSKDKFGQCRGAAPKTEDNLQLDPDSEWKVRDKSNHDNFIRLYDDVPGIVTDILKNGAQLAIVSRNKSKALCDRALWYFKAIDPKTSKKKSIIYMVTYDEVVDEEITAHFERIHGWSGYDYSEMILFDDAAWHNRVRLKLGVTFQVTRDRRGLTWDTYNKGIELWRRCKRIRSPYIDQNLSSYPRRVFLGYSGMDEGTVKLLTQGKSRVDLKESARWGYATYITDNPSIAKYFSNWIKADAFGADTKTCVCEMWIRDKNIFDNLGKIWVPELGFLMTNNKKWLHQRTAWSQEDRDQLVSRWGVDVPYILFSRHHWMKDMPIPQGKRWNEMVIYRQTQDALLLTIPLTPKQLEERIQGNFVTYESQIKAWNITVPPDTWANFKKAKEDWIKP